MLVNPPGPEPTTTASYLLACEAYVLKTLCVRGAVVAVDLQVLEKT